jgi:U3 small nucleolar RNA-associated protein 5
MNCRLHIKRLQNPHRTYTNFNVQAAHGGYLASQPQLVKQLSALNKVLKERSSGLMPLMSLKGRLDMLQAQLDLRKRNQQRADDENDEVIYIEGEHDYVSSDEEADQVDATPRATPKRLRQDEDEDDSSNDEMTYNVEVNEDEEGSEDSDDEDLIDDEAEETDNDELSDPESEDLELNGEGVSESEEEVRPERRSTAARSRR